MIRVYSRSDCQSCKSVKRWLERKGQMFEEIDLDVDDSRVEEFKHSGLVSLPIVEFSNGFLTSGFNPPALIQGCQNE